MLGSSQAPVVVTQEALLGHAAAWTALAVVCLDRDWTAIAARPTSRPPQPSRPRAARLRDLHLGLDRPAQGRADPPPGAGQLPRPRCASTPGLSAEDVLVAVTTLSFDIAGLELYLPLIIGARGRDRAGRDGGGSARAGRVCSQRSAGDRHAGDADHVADAARLRLDARAARSRRCAAASRCRSRWPTAWSSRRGRAVEHVRADRNDDLVDVRAGHDARRDAHDRPADRQHHASTSSTSTSSPVPVGVAGELWIGGDGLARGYRGRDDLTDGALPHRPLRARRAGGSTAPATWRATAPTARSSSSAASTTRSRSAATASSWARSRPCSRAIPQIAEAVVVARADADGDAELAAYVIPSGEPVPAHELREFVGAAACPPTWCRSRSPRSDAFPLTPNGKVDRKALPEPTRERSEEHELDRAADTDSSAASPRSGSASSQISPIGVTRQLLRPRRDLDRGRAAVRRHRARARRAACRSGRSSGPRRSRRWPSCSRPQRTNRAGPRSIPIQPAGLPSRRSSVSTAAPGTILHLAALARRLGPDQPFYGLQSARPVRRCAAVAAPSRRWPRITYRRCARCIPAVRGAWRATASARSSPSSWPSGSVAAGEEVEMLAMFNGPSPAWIRQWGWYRQPTRAGAPSTPSPRVRPSSRDA